MAALLDCTVRVSFVHARPHPSPLPRGEGESHSAFGEPGAFVVSKAVCRSPSPLGRGPG